MPSVFCSLLCVVTSLKERWQPEADQIDKFSAAAESVKNKMKIEVSLTCVVAARRVQRGYLTAQMTTTLCRTICC